MRKVGAGAAIAIVILASCAPVPQTGQPSAEMAEISPDSTLSADYDRMFLEIHSALTAVGW